MKIYELEKILFLAHEVRKSVLETAGTIKGRSVNGFSGAGDAQFDVDYRAEETVKEVVNEYFTECFLYTEDYKDTNAIGKKSLMIVDPIDGTRAAAAGLEMATIAIAIADYSHEATINDIKQALVMELKSGAWIYADCLNDPIKSSGFNLEMPNINKNANFKNMFWSFEFNGHPAKLMVEKWGDIVDKTANTGGVFIFNSASYSILKVISGQMDAYVDIGNRILKDKPELLPEFEKVGNGQVLHLFPYDIAAICFIAQKVGLCITDAYGKSLNATKLLDFGWRNQQSCIATATHALHSELMSAIKWSD